MYVYLKIGENLTTNMGDMAKSLFLPFFLFFSLLLSFLFFSLNPSISKPIGGIGLNLVYKQGPMTRCAVTCQNVCKQQQFIPIIHYKGEILLHITGYLL